MADSQTTIENLREQIDKLPVEYRVIVRYLDVKLDMQEQSTRELKQAFETARGALTAVKWLAGVGAAIAAIWAGFHANISVK